VATWELHAGTTGSTGDVMLKVDNVSLSFGGVKAIKDISFDIHKGEIRAIIGPNGAGKTSMLNVINGFYHPQEGPDHLPRRRPALRMQPYEAAARALRAPSRTWRCSRACRRSTTSCRAAR
jgi:branched-chain amino acid transport system ATP-binding protein